MVFGKHAEWWKCTYDQNCVALFGIQYTLYCFYTNSFALLWAGKTQNANCTSVIQCL